MNKVKLKTVKLSQIKPYWNNPRHIENAINATQKSIELYGYNVPITVDSEGVIVTGHTRYQALLRSDIKEIQVIDLSHLTEAQINEFRIADNKTSEMAEWDDTKLLTELKTMTESLPNIQHFFEVDLDAVVKSATGSFQMPEVSQEELNAKQREIDARFNTDQDTLEIICPSCFHEFNLMKSEVK